MTTGSLRVLVVHNRYRSGQPSGEDRVVDQEIALLRAAGHRVMLFERHSERVALWKFAPGARLDRHEHRGGEEMFVLDGVLEDELGRYPKGAWLRNPPGSAHAPFSDEGCLLYVKTGHLAG